MSPGMASWPGSAGRFGMPAAPGWPRQGPAEPAGGTPGAPRRSARHGLTGSAQGPGPVAAAQASVDQGPQVQRGAPVMQPGVVPGSPDVAEPDPVPVLGSGPGDDPLDHRPGRVGLPELGGPGLGAGGAQQAVVVQPPDRRPGPSARRALPTTHSPRAHRPWRTTTSQASSAGPGKTRNPAPGVLCHGT